MNEKYELIMLLGKPVLFAECRIDDSEIPGELYKYESRYDDSVDGGMVEVKTHVAVNFLATIIAAEEFETTMERDFDIDSGVPVDQSDYNYLGEFYTMQEYSEKYDEIVARMSSNKKLSACFAACNLINALDQIDDTEFVDSLIGFISSNDAVSLGQFAARLIIGGK
jgi:hypothetical protein